MDTIILAGGLGTRMREETEFRPKPMVPIGGRPVLWHIMKGLSEFGLRDFRVATGYRADVIQDYFLNFQARTRDLTVHLTPAPTIEYLGSDGAADWSVSLLNTGLDATTADRVIACVRRCGITSTFLTVYGDGLADVNISALRAAHAAHGRLATVTLHRYQSRFGVADLGEDGRVARFREKPVTDSLISIGYILLEPAALEFFQAGESLEEGPLARLAAAGELTAYVHEGFWEPMDTYREYLDLNALWDSGRAPWKTWSG